ncbi:MAG TPA: hypothetical protein VGR46_02255 [Candidatus Limnocylindria bacterium]|nr:hypothetical protein [Candidatus Limnocylindria bacterium]
MAVLRCERIADGDVDRAIASIGTATLARMPDGAFVEVEDPQSARAQRLLAFAGVRATAGLQTLAPRPGTRAAVGRDLTPLPLGSVALDLVHVRALAPGIETQRLLRSRWGRRARATDRALVRALLRGDEMAIGWRRRAWTTRDVLRSAEARRALRAVVFDVGAIVAPPEHRVFAKDGALARWLFG